VEDRFTVATSGLTNEKKGVPANPHSRYPLNKHP